MASLNMAPEELKQLELMRNRFLQLTHSLESLWRDVYRIQPLPSGESLQASATILQQNIRSIQEISNDNADLFQRVVVHPSTNFPGRTQSGVLLALLRKKLEPDVEHWVEDARDAARAAGIDASKLGVNHVGGGNFAGAGRNGQGNNEEEDDDEYGYDPDAQGDDPFNEQWGDVRDACLEGITDYIRNQASEPYTAAERAMGTQNVRTGLKRSLEDDEYEDESDESDEEGGAGGPGDKMDEDVVEVPRPGAAGVPLRPPQAHPGASGGSFGGGENMIQPEHMLWFLARGDMKIPPNLDMDFSRKMRESNKRAGPGR